MTKYPTLSCVGRVIGGKSSSTITDYVLVCEVYGILHVFTVGGGRKLRAEGI